MKILTCFLIVLLLPACSETPPIDETIDETRYITLRCLEDGCAGRDPTVSLMMVLIRPNPFDAGYHSGQNFFLLQSDMPMSKTTIILVAEKYMRSPSSFSTLLGDSRRREATRHFFVEMKKGTLQSAVLHTFADGDVFLPPPELRHNHLDFSSGFDDEDVLITSIPQEGDVTIIADGGTTVNIGVPDEHGEVKIPSRNTYRVGDTFIESDYEWNHYKVGDPSSITFPDETGTDD